MPAKKQPAHEGHPPSLDPWSALKAGVEAVPAVKYAVGVVAISAAASLTRAYFNSLRIAALATVVLLGLMCLLWVFSRLVALASRDLRWPTLGLAWTFLLLTMASVLLLFLSVFFRIPRPLPAIVDDFLDRPFSQDAGGAAQEDRSQPKSDTARVDSDVRIKNPAHDTLTDKTPGAANTRTADRSIHQSPTDAKSHPVADRSVSSSRIQNFNVPPDTQQATASRAVAKPVEICPRPQNDDNARYSSIPDDATTDFGTVGDEAFRRGDYEWSCYLLSQERRYATLSLWRVNQPYLAGALYKMGREQAGKDQLDDLVSAVTVRKA